VKRAPDPFFFPSSDD